MPYSQSVSSRKLLTVISIAALLIAVLLPIFSSTSGVEAAQLTAREIDIQSSEADYETDYLVSFDVPAGTQVGGFIIEFCDNDPLPNTQCDYDDEGDDIPCLDEHSAGTDSACNTEVTLNGSPNFDSEAITMQAINVDENVIEFTLATDTTPAGTSTLSIQLDDVDNPDNSTDGGADNNVFYARIYAMADNTLPGFAGGPATTMATTEVAHSGGVALSTAEQITIDARVQEILDFCVGTQVTTIGDCDTISGNSIDLGVLDQTSVTYSADLDTGGTDDVCEHDYDECALLIVTTNATDDGVAIDYRADGFSVGTTCTDGGTTAGGSTTDQCLNPVHETVETSMVTAGEDWGIAVIETDAHASSSIGPNITTGAASDVFEAYNFDTSGYAVDDDNTSSIALAQSDRTAGDTAGERVVDREQIEIEIAASPAYTTPSGAYQTTLEFIATGSF